jgi:hypothetical protein
MSGRNELAELQLRKRALVLESDLLRLTLQTECRSWSARTAWVGETAQAYQKFRPWLVVLAPLAGVLAARTLRRPQPSGGRLATALKWAQTVYLLWKSLSATPELPASRETLRR